MHCILAQCTVYVGWRDIVLKHCVTCKRYLGGKPGLPDMGYCKYVLGINVFRGPPCTTSRWTTLLLCCWK